MTALGAADVPEHAVVWLARALRQPPALAARADIAKCAGAALTACSTCVRALAPAGAGQQWAEPMVVGAGCALYASVERYASLYAPAVGVPSK